MSRVRTAGLVMMLLLFTAFAGAALLGLLSAGPQDPNDPDYPLADTNGDLAVNVFDLSYMLSKWQQADDRADFTGDGRVTIFDLSYMLAQWQRVDDPMPPGSVSGEDIPADDVPGWRQIFADDFTTDVPLGSFPGAVSDTWGAYPLGWRDTKGQQNTNAEIGGWYDAGRVVSVHDGVLDKWLHTETIDGVERRLVAAVQPKLFSNDAFDGQLYGRYAIRFKMDPGLRGYKVAWLLWPDSEIWPRDGEIDFPEGDLDGHIEGYMHWQGGPTGSSQWYALSNKTFTDWHTAVIEWGPGRVAYYLDGELMTDASYGDSDWTEEPDKVPNTPMHYVIQTETTLNNIIPDASTQGHVLIDWVAVWERE